MRTWGRILEKGKKVWVEVKPDADGDSSYFWLTTLIQTLKLNLGESPFYINYGIPAQQSIVTQIYPDYYVNQVQRQFAPYFASLTINKVDNTLNPTYDVNVVFFNGTTFRQQIAT
ncbi:hypothetical protein QE197_10870 [Arsenophonus nasoniae]|uniref:Uncharacterized protein n=1 Tax=Arsenophonus nasoniae TaxID=638 RepID=A0A4P7KUY2_9GAMM|nr:hypothetical protein [Arsenophonus nasoniae]QBY43967.1 hypothetical protein ArsFIN_25400 [Arsenophonus nasoniae]WGM04285.1 hypothetical protein QE258_11600 [Arsenophonus nasoniae]WGM09387.1 hypothetical protein QE197_10870 [Arsenophonus nasoniae]WGM14112.1 hypothetical protein QE193_10765 [Arsenophonus nasoniae]